jgi:hypothetical protein
MVAMPNEEVHKPLSRLERYNLQSDGRLPKSIRDLMDRVITGSGSRIFQRNYKKYLGELTPYGGSTWWALTPDACNHIIDFIENNSAVVEFFVNTVCPDEMVFQTIIGNSPFRNSVRRNLTYADWFSPGRKPAIIDERHIEIFEASKAGIIADDCYGKGELLFARKFPDNSDRLVNRIDKLSSPDQR